MELKTGNAAAKVSFLRGKLMLSTIAALFSVVLLLLFIHLLVRCLLRRRHQRPLLSLESHGAASASKGLDAQVLRSLPVAAYSGGGGECAVCLSELEEGDKVRSLPLCGHGFHVDCIDAWFRSHATCPLCRSVVEEVARHPAAVEVVVGTCSTEAPPLPLATE